ncbi:MAG: hypothetical protein Q4E17_05330 [Synergistes sp.]|nr:hypothetical protein [Synergistes sp.]
MYNVIAMLFDVRVNISENKITVENNGCPIGTSYDLIVLAEGANHRKAVKILKILVGEASETEGNI